MKNIFGTTAAVEELCESPNHKKRSIWKYTGLLFLILFVGSMLSSAIISPPLTLLMFLSDEVKEAISSSTADYNAMYDMVYNAMTNWSLRHPNIFMSIQLFGTAATIAITILFANKFDNRRLANLGIIKKGAVKEYLFGLFVGVLMFCATYGIMLASGQIKFVGISPKLHIGALITFFFAYMVQGMNEELLVRGFYMVGLGSFNKMRFAVFASAMAFSILHFGNNGMSVMAFVNLFLFGVFAALYFIRRGNIWGVAAMHSVWNYTQGQIFGCSVSGNYGATSLFETTYKEGNTLFNGGAFGPEGGLAVTIVFVIGIIVLLPMKNKRIDLPLPRYKGEFHSAV